MFIMIGAGSGHRKKAYLGVRICPHCGKLSHFYLMEQAQQVSLFFVPVVRWGKHWGIACSRCKAGFEIEDTEKDFCLKQAQWMPSEKQMNEVIEYIGVQLQAGGGLDNETLRERVRLRFDFHVDGRSFEEIVKALRQAAQREGQFRQFY